MGSLSSVLKKRRKELGLTLAQIADAMGVSEATVQRWESGNIKTLRYGKMEKLAEILNISPAYLMGWEDKSGETDLGLVYMDLAEMFNTTPEVIEAAMDGMSFPNGIGLPAMKAISRKIKISAVQQDSGLTTDEQALLEIYRSLTPERREKLTTMVRAFVEALR